MTSDIKITVVSPPEFYREASAVLTMGTTSTNTMNTTTNSPRALPASDLLGTWQPIASAPRAVEILLGDMGSKYVFIGIREGRKWLDDRGFEIDLITPSHWMPLPPPPNAEANDKLTNCGRERTPQTQKPL